MGQSAINPTLLTAMNGTMKTSTAGLNSAGSGCVINLFTNNVVPTSQMLISTTNFTTPSFTGYTAVTLTSVACTSGYNSSGQNIELITNAVDFTASSASGETIYGYYISNANLSGQAVYAKTLDTPITVTTVGQIIPIVPQVSLSNNSGGN